MRLRWFPWKFIIRRLARSHGFVDPIAILSHLRRFAQPSEVAVPIELLRAGVVFHARGLINSRVIQQNLDWVWPYWVHRQFDPSDPAFIPRAFSLTHVNLTARNWTAVGVPGCDALPIVGPRGLVTPFWDGWSLDPWIVAEDGRVLTPSRAADVAQRLDIRGGVAVVTSARRGTLELESRVEAVAEPVLACQLTLTARAAERAWLVVAVRPCNPEGISFIYRISLNERRDEWHINRKHRVRFAEPVERHAVSDYVQGDVVHRLLEPQDAESVACDVGMATAAALFEIPRHQARTITVRVPLADHTWHGAEYHRRQAVPGGWDDELRPASRLTLPDERMQFLYEAALRTLILHTPDDVYAGPFTYKRFWFRDAAFILHAMLCAGLTRRAEAAIDRFFSRQTGAGYFRSQEGEWDANGQVLWILRRWCELAGREPRKEWAGPIARAARWIMRKRVSRDADALHAGLMPAGFSAEHLGPNDYYYWDDFWSVAGLRAAGQMLRTLGKTKTAVECDLHADDLTAAIERSLAVVRSRLDSPAIPASCYRRLDSGAIGSIVAGYPLQVLDRRDERLTGTADYLLNHCIVGGGFFQDMIHSGINIYLTLHIAQVLLRAGDGRFADLVRAVARLASPTGQWPEAIHPHTLGGCMGDGQHAWAAAEWVMMMRNGLLHEETHSPRLVLGAGVLPEWLRPGASLAIDPAPTSWGPVRLSVEVGNETAHVRWNGAWHAQPPEIEVRLPASEPVVVGVDRTDIEIKLTR